MIAGTVTAGLTICELAQSTGRPLPLLRILLSEELAAGRVRRDADGRYSIVPSAFRPGVVAALAALEADRVADRSDLADRLASALLDRGPLPCERLARLVGARTADVLSTLRTDPRFEHEGSRRGSRWRLALAPSRNGREGLGRNPAAESMPNLDPIIAAHLAALDARVAILERRLGEVDAPA